MCSDALYTAAQVTPVQLLKERGGTRGSGDDALADPGEPAGAPTPESGFNFPLNGGGFGRPLDSRKTPRRYPTPADAPTAGPVQENTSGLPTPSYSRIPGSERGAS